MQVREATKLVLWVMGLLPFVAMRLLSYPKGSVSVCIFSFGNVFQVLALCQGGIQRRHGSGTCLLQLFSWKMFLSVVPRIPKLECPGSWGWGGVGWGVLAKMQIPGLH